MKLLLLILLTTLLPAAPLPLSKTFIGDKKFQALVAAAAQGQWQRLPLGQRVATVGMALQGVPYQGFTLEIDDRIESPSVNFDGMDCWTFFETSLAFASMLENDTPPHTPEDLLAEIETTRYRDGVCRGNYLDRLHYLIEWFSDNQRRGNISDITRTFPNARIPSQTGEMSRLWKSYRYLKNNPALRAGMARQEAALNQLRPVMVPKEKVRAIESRLATGDIVGIARNDGGSYCSHVGLIVKDQAGRARLLHASSTAKKVILDAPISDYLARNSKQAGIIIARPQ